MKSDLSEFSYGYALTEHLIRWEGTQLMGAPIFPNLYEEGQQGFGYDVNFDRPGIPLFLQFKTSHYMKSLNAMEFHPNSPPISLSPPFFRMKLRPTRYSNQHPSLLTLEVGGGEVYYAAPAFHLRSELNDAYLNRLVVGRSVFFRPSDIGQLPDDLGHHVAFDPAQDAQYGYMYSEPTRVRIFRPGDFAENVSRRIREEGNLALSRDYLTSLKTHLVEARGEQSALVLRSLEKFPGIHITSAVFRWADSVRDLRSLAYLARTFLDCQLFVVQHKEARST